MKSLILALSVAVASVGFLPMQVDAKRLGGGGSSGMQRSVPTRPAPDSAPARPATPAPAAAPGATPTPSPARSWMGPIAGLAAGLGIAALMSHMGLGAGMGNMLTLLIMAAAAFFVIRFLMRRFAPNAGASASRPMAYAGAGAGAPFPTAAGSGNGPRWEPTAGGMQPAAATASAVPVATTLPAGFDAAAFERIAKMIFIRMQAANDTADLADLRNFTTPELFASIRLELQERGGASQQTDVVRIDAEVLDVTTEAERQVVSVRFHGLIREEKDGVAQPFDEVWHLVKPVDGSREWAIAGIQQAQTAA